MITPLSNKVYFVHGFASLGFEMRNLLRASEREGFVCKLFRYRSLTQDIDFAALDLITMIRLDGAEKISFVTHSMGALVVRSVFKSINKLKDFPEIQRIIMIAPPNNGTPVADFYHRFRLFRYILGPNLKNLTTDSVSGASRYPIPNCEVGVVTGSYKGSKIMNIFLKEANDGMIIPEQAKLGNEKDSINIKSWHLGLMYNKKVEKYVVSFLKYGKFIME
jgi:uncharacterized alpha/beta hydrolase family protein